MLLDDLTKEGYVCVWCPGEVLELEADEVDFCEPDADGSMPTAAMARLADPTQLLQVRSRATLSMKYRENGY